MYIEKYGFRPSDMPETNTGNTPARITAVYRGRFEIACEFGTGFARLKPGVYYAGNESIPTTGDFVLLDRQENGDSRIIKTLPRRTCFSRLNSSSSGREEQAVAANFDYVFILQSLNRDFNPRRLERYLTLAWQSGAVPAVILTKSDGIENASAYICGARAAAAGADVFAVSAKTGYGLNKLEPYLKPGKTIVFLGSSGVGKSTLVNTLAGKEVMATGSVREQDSRGRHTTSHRQLFLLESGVMVIDTPGMRELGMWEVEKGLGQSFSDVEQFLGHCRFSDCRHQTEPGCAVTDAIRRGELSQSRWESYKKLHTEAEFTDDKTGYLRQKRQKFKEIAKYQKAIKSPDYRHTPCAESFYCTACGKLVTPENAGSGHRNHCPHCLTSIHADNKPGDRASLCKGRMDPIAVWVRKNGEWAIIHRCRICGTLSSNRIAADDNASLLLSMAMKPLAAPLQTQGKEPVPAHSATAADATGRDHTCKVCGTLKGADRNGHCPQCLSGIHTGSLHADGTTPCMGIMEPIAVWVRNSGDWEVVTRCRNCGTLKTSSVACYDNTALLLSIAMKPLASPPFPLWQADCLSAGEA